MAKTILIVDDSSSLRMVVKIALTRAGYDVIEASDGRDGLAQLDKAGKVHLIVSDVNMPNMDGITFVTHVKAHPRHRFTPVVMLTTEGQDSKKDQGRAAELDGDAVGHGVGVDVVGLPVGAAAEAGEHGDVAMAGEQREQIAVDGGDVADEAEIHRVGAGAGVDGGRAALGLDHPRAGAVEADGPRRGRDEGGAEVDVELAGDDHLHDVERGAVGDAAAGDLPRRHPELGLQPGGLRAAAVDHHHRGAGGDDRGDVRGEDREPGGGDDLAAELDDQGRAHGRAHG